MYVCTQGVRTTEGGMGEGGAHNNILFTVFGMVGSLTRQSGQSRRAVQY